MGYRWESIGTTKFVVSPAGRVMDRVQKLLDGTYSAGMLKFIDEKSAMSYLEATFRFGDNANGYNGTPPKGRS